MKNLKKIVKAKPYLPIVVVGVFAVALGVLFIIPREVSATEQSCPAFFEDSFESGNFDLWTSHDNDWHVNSGSGHTGSKKAYVCDQGASADILLKEISTIGYDSIKLEYYYRANQPLESTDHAYVEWWDGSNWHQLADHKSLSVGGWTQASYSLPAGAANNSNFKFRFKASGLEQCSGGGDKDEFQLDDVALTGCQQPATIIASKVVCDSEADLPDWGDHGATIGANTASNYVANSNGKCDLETNWDFQWAYDYQANPGNNEGAQSAPWNTFTNTTQINNLSNDKIWLREVWNSQYIPFSGDYTKPYDTVSAEFYCQGDVLNYDNYEWIDNLQHGQTYYCVGFNALQEYCGDNIVNGDEQCDGNSQPCTDQNGYNGTQLCTNSCTWDECVPSESCGDGTPNGNEDCDNGANNGNACTPPYDDSCTYCSANCTNITLNGPYCGDDIVNGEEQCDSNSQSCTTSEGYAGNQTCNMPLALGEFTIATVRPDYCTWNSCVTKESCGDGIINGPEECDGTAGVGANQSCSQDCKLINLTYCGDGIVNGDEQCDTNPQACTTAEGYAGTQTCNMPPLKAAVAEVTDEVIIETPYCNWNPCATEEKCGDGIKNGNELCDGTDGVVEHQNCLPNCTIEGVPYCGDGIKNGMEQCDKTDGITGSQTCSSDCKIVEPTLAVTPTVTLTKTDTPDPVAAGANLTYTLNFTITNASATNVIITDTIPANTTFISASTPGAYDALTNKVTWSFGTLTAGNYVATLTVKVYSPLAKGTKINNTATIDSTETEPLPASADTTASTAPILTMDKLVDKAAANAGDTINYTVKVLNSGTDTAVNVKLTDTLPAGLTFVDNGTSTMTFSFGNIEAGKSVATTYAVKISSTIAKGTYTNTAAITSDNYSKLTDSVDVAVAVPKILGEEVEEAPAPAVKVLGEELPDTGSGFLNWLYVLIGACLISFSLYILRLTSKKA